MLGMGIAVSAHAIPTLTISDGSGINLSVPASGGFAFGGASDGYWTVAISGALTTPAVGSAIAPILDLRIQAVSALGRQASALTITWSDTGFGAYNGSLAGRLSGYAISGTGQNVTFNTYYDAGNRLGVQSTLLTSSGNLSDPPGYDSSVLGTVNQNLFSLTEVITIANSINAGAAYSLDGSISPASALVPDGGTTAALLGGVLLILALLQRKSALTMCRLEKCKRQQMLKPQNRKANMSEGLKVVLASAALAGLTNWANAAATVSLYDGVNPLITVVDNGPGDLTGTTGTITNYTNVGVWNVVSISVITKPFFGSATDPVMDVNFQAYSTAAGSLRVVFSDNGFGPASGTVHARVDGHIVSGAPATASYSVYGDPANVVGATTVPIASTGTTPLPGPQAGSGLLTLPTPYSLTEVIQLVASGAGGYDVEAGFDPPNVSTGLPRIGSVGYAAVSDTTGTKLELQVPTVSGYDYVLQSSPVAGPTGVWSGILTNAGTGGTITNVVAVDPAKGQEYFRYQVQ